MYVSNRGLIEWQIDKDLFKHNLISKCDIYNQDINNIKFYSQQDEDKYIIQYILKEKISDGVFLEIGACDGILYTNTKTLEDYFGFTGILIEPQSLFFNKLINNRPNCECYNYVVSNSDSEKIQFTGTGAEGGITESINTNKFNNEYYVRNIKMKDLLNKSRFKYIDIMIIDVEGGELELLKSIDFSFPIYCIIIEAHSTEQEKNKKFGEYLKKNNFTYKERQRGNEVWINTNYFRKHLFNC